MNGFSGCTGSADGVHIPWEMCPAGIHSRCKGKEGFPTIAFNVVSSHTRQVLAVSKAFYGTGNDKTMARQDDAIHKIVAGSFKDFEWMLMAILLLKLALTFLLTGATFRCRALSVQNHPTVMRTTSAS